jgi:hypothetical protein
VPKISHEIQTWEIFFMHLSKYIIIIIIL